MQRSKKLKSELPDFVKSYIFSKLNLKDLVKTSALSKLWRHEWELRKELNFDIHNMFGQGLPKKLTLTLFDFVQSKFASSLDQFMLHYQGDTIHSIRVKFPLDDVHGDVIDRLIIKGISKGAKHIELLFSCQIDDTDDVLEMEPYKFPFALLSDTDSLTYLHLQNCYLGEPLEFSGLKNLRTLVLHLVSVKDDLLEGMLSNCIHLVDFTLDACEFNSNLIIISPTLLHMNIVNCEVGIGEERNIDIIASNLSSLEYSCNGNRVHSMNIKADMLSKFSFRGSEISESTGFSGLKNVTSIVLDGLREFLTEIIPRLFSECLQLEDATFKNCWMMCELKIIGPKLRHLSIIDCSYEGYSPFKIAIDAFNLSTFEYSGKTRVFSVKAPRLTKLFWNATTNEETPFAIGLYESLHYIENLTVVMNTSQIEKFIEVLVEFEKLKQLELFIEGAYDPNVDYFLILDIIMASKHLEKLSLTIRNSRMEISHVVELESERSEYAEIFHNNLKYVELHGCVCIIDVFELTSYLLRMATSLKKITFSSLDKIYLGAGRWTKESDTCCSGFERTLVHRMLRDDVNEHFQLKL
ncbi:hypothetical protein TSUD_334410 [Trifolium subterraneum]|uniref:F-box domain-containing protein n=1 Tax=Trifolium subterraneum TaxID=3900 RepID=A0A2Z6M0A2_TRISU|nr:hypothetical protein TSUD_334410 [Trifolium subterraneum]